MGRLWLAALAALALAGCAAQGRPSAADPPPTGPHQPKAEVAPATLDEMLEGSDFDLPRALLLFSRDYYGDFAATPHTLDIEARLARFDQYGVELRRELGRRSSPRSRLLALVDFVHSRLGLHFDSQDAAGANPENLFLDRVLQSRRGYCVTLSLAYLVFGQAAGLDVHGVRLPGHFVVLYRDKEADGTPWQTLVETTTGGEPRDELDLWAQHRFSTTAVEARVYLAPLTDREIFSTLFNNLAGVVYLRGNAEKALAHYQRALELAPNNAEALYNRALVLTGLGRPKDALKDLNAALRLDTNFVLALLARSGLLWKNNERDAALKDLAEAKRKRPDWPEPHLLEGGFCALEGRLDDARSAFQRALAADGKCKDAHLALAELERRAGNEQAAREHEKAAEELHP
ncbi:MAG: tetratricopeptide repeat protein [Planctomycetes bacterium]|nr:tetratricopeptide repeat protein [Planctomycetota bacterium]